MKFAKTAPQHKIDKKQNIRYHDILIKEEA